MKANYQHIWLWLLVAILIVPTVYGQGETTLVANFTNGNTDFFRSRVYLWNPSSSDASITVRVFSLTRSGPSQLLGTADLDLIEAETARNIRLEDIFVSIGLPAPYEQNSGNITLEFTVGADNVRGSAQVFNNSFTLAFGTYPLQEISTTTDTGITLINQDLALAGGVTLGDTPGFPVTLSESGSYILTGNLIVDRNTTGIFVSADNVTIDLNGFAIIGPGFPGFGRGVEVENIFNLIIFSNTTVVNGTIQGVGSTGVRLANSARVENVRVTGAGLAGIDVSSGSTVTGNTAVNNGDDGIRAGSGSTVTGNTAVNNGDDGINVGSGSTVIGNTAVDNGDDGINAGSGSTVTGNTAVDNGDFGISASSGSTVTGNTANDNRRRGLFLGVSSGFGNNVLTENNGGNANPQVDGGIEIGTNVCGTNTIYP